MLKCYHVVFDTSTNVTQKEPVNTESFIVEVLVVWDVGMVGGHILFIN